MAFRKRHTWGGQSLLVCTYALLNKCHFRGSHHIIGEKCERSKWVLVAEDCLGYMYCSSSIASTITNEQSSDDEDSFEIKRVADPPLLGRSTPSRIWRRTGGAKHNKGKKHKKTLSQEGQRRRRDLRKSASVMN